MAFTRKYGVLLVTGSTSIRIPMIKRAAVDFALGADWTPAAGDVKVFVDGAAAANITNLPTAIASGNGAFWEFILTAAELSCKQLLVVVVDAATKAVEDQSFIVETYGHASAMYVADLSLANLPANITQLLGTAWLTPGTAGTPDVNTKLVGGQTASAAGAVTFPGTIASTTNITAGTLTTVTTLTNLPAITAGWLTATGIAADAITDAKVAADVTIASVTGAVGSVTGAVGSVTGNVGGNVTGSVGSIAAAGIAANSFAAAALNAIADADLDRNMATGTDSGTDSTVVRTPRQALRVLRNKTSITAGSATITKEDDVTASWTAAITTAAGNPITGVDPT